MRKKLIMKMDYRLGSRVIESEWEMSSSDLK